MKDANFYEKMGLLGLAGVAIVSLTWIAIVALKADTVDPNGATLIGAIATGLIAVGKDIVSAIRGYSMSAQLEKVTTQLSESRPAGDSSEQQSVEVVNTEKKPVPTTGIKK